MKNFSTFLLLCELAGLPLRSTAANAASVPASNSNPSSDENLAQDVASRSRDLDRLFDEIWQDKLRHEPEYATYLGDKHYDDQLTDYSPRAVNQSLARGRAFIQPSRSSTQPACRIGSSSNSRSRRHPA